MRRTIMFLFALLTLAAAAASGKWKGNLETDDGSRELTFILKVDRGNLASTVAGLLDRTLDVDEGKVEGATITFSVISELDGNAVKLVYKGELAGDANQIHPGYRRRKLEHGNQGEASSLITRSHQRPVASIDAT